MQQSSTTLFQSMPDRIGETRLLTPFAVRALDLWFMLQLWPDSQDQDTLRQVQRAVRQRSQPQAKPLNPRKLSDAARLEMALKLLTFRDEKAIQYRVRNWFAVAAHKESRLRRNKRPYDVFAAWAGLVSQRYDPGEWPIQFLSALGALELDGILMRGGQTTAERIARDTFDAIQIAFHAEFGSFEGETQ